MVNERFKYYDAKFWYCDWKNKLNYFIDDLPDEYKKFFDVIKKNVPVINNKTRIVTLINTRLADESFLANI